MTYNTNNPVPSVDVRDLYDNAQNLDSLVNGAAPAYADRLGVSRKSYKGMELDFSAFLASSGFELPALEYVDGSSLTVDRPTQLIERDGILYSVKATESFPATLTGTFAADQDRLVVRTDSDLRQQLAAVEGASLVGHSYGGESQKSFTVAEVLNGLSVPASANGALESDSDATVKLQSVINVLPAGGTIDGQGKTYNVTSLRLKSRMKLRNIKLVTIANSAAFSSPITIDGTVGGDKSHIYLEDVEVDGNRSGFTNIVTPGPEDGGLHGVRILAKCSDIYINRVKVKAAGSYGIFLGGLPPGITDSYAGLTNIVIRDSSFTGCRAHGGASDSTFGCRLINVELKDNGNDLNTTDPLNHGNRGARTVGGLFGTGWDFEGYGLGSSINDLHLNTVVAVGNARMGILFFDQLETRPAEFVARQKIWISDCYFGAGIDPEGDGTAFTFSSTIASKELAPLYDSIYVTNTRLDGRIILRAVNNLIFQGEIRYSRDPSFALLDYATNIKFDVVTPGSAKLVNANASTYKIVANLAQSPGSPALEKISGPAGSLSDVVVTPLGGVAGVSYRFQIAATWTGAAGTVIFRINPAAGGSFSGSPRFEAVASATGNTLPAAYMEAYNYARVTDPGTGVVYIQAIVDVAV